MACMIMKSAVIPSRLMSRAPPFLLYSAQLGLEIKALKSLFHFEFCLNHNFMQEMTVIFESKWGTGEQVHSGVAVSSGPAPDRAVAPSFIARSVGQLPYLPLYDATDVSSG